jgi:hypothetical protein
MRAQFTSAGFFLYTGFQQLGTQKIIIIELPKYFYTFYDFNRCEKLKIYKQFLEHLYLTPIAYSYAAECLTI